MTSLCNRILCYRSMKPDLPKHSSNGGADPMPKIHNNRYQAVLHQLFSLMTQHGVLDLAGPASSCPLPPASIPSPTLPSQGTSLLFTSLQPGTLGYPVIYTNIL